MKRLTREQFHRLIPEARPGYDVSRESWADSECIFYLGKDNAVRTEAIEFLEPFESPFHVMDHPLGRFLEVKDPRVATLFWIRFA